jgi:hypothetical protein
VAANQKAATAFVQSESGGGLSKRGRLTPVYALPRAIGLGIASCCLLLFPAQANGASNKVRITNLADVAFGSLANLSIDAVRSQSVCLFADTNTNGYTITASGTGPSGSFQLTSGLTALAYEVQWNSSTGQSSGVQLTPNVPLAGQISGATHQTCGNGPATSASLVLVLRSTALSSARAGTYSGTLTIIVGPE